MSKIDEMRRLAAAGLPIPAFEVIGPDTRLSADDYGTFVLVKPSYSFASFGQGIELCRTSTLRYRAPAEFPEWHPGRQAPMFAQKFIDCGYPMSCRVLTIFGEPIFTYCRQSTKPLNLNPEKDIFEQHEYLPAPPDRTTFITREPDLLKLAADAYRAMPEVALQACDIVRETVTGRLYLLEVNPGGGTWMFSSESCGSYKNHWVSAIWPRNSMRFGPSRAFWSSAHGPKLSRRRREPTAELEQITIAPGLTFNACAAGGA